jgi:S-adenosyl-L-methionine hydrolase (adenosine-forming)
VAPSEQRRYDWVTLTSDYGLEDVFVGVCKGVVAQIAPHVRFLDVCHLIAAQDVEQGANSLAAAMPYLPVAVHLALVDPMHRSSSRGVVVLTADDSLFVGPDNGVLSFVSDGRGDVVKAVEIANPTLWRATVHKSFRGRDVFSPVAGHLANGTPLSDVGPDVDPATLVRLPVRSVVVDDDHVHGEVTLVDHFGNVSLNLARSDLEAAGISFGDTVEVRCNGRTLTVPFTATYGDVSRGRLALCEDSFRAVMFAVNAGHASRELRVTRGEPVVIARLPQQAARH